MANGGPQIVRVPPNAASTPQAQAHGMLTWNFDPALTAASTAPTAGTRYGSPVYLSQGQVVTNTVHLVGTAQGAGTVPTSIFTGLCSATAMLRQSADVKADTQWSAAAQVFAQIPLTSPVTVQTSGLYYVMLLQVGSWGTTQLTLSRYLATPILPNGSFGQATFGTAQTILPADGVSPGTVANGTLRYWVGVS